MDTLGKILNFIILITISFAMLFIPAILTIIASLQFPLFTILGIVIGSLLIFCFIYSIFVVYKDIFGDKKK